MKVPLFFSGILYVKLFNILWTLHLSYSYSFSWGFFGPLILKSSVYLYLNCLLYRVYVWLDLPLKNIYSDKYSFLIGLLSALKFNIILNMVGPWSNRS